VATSARTGHKWTDEEIGKLLLMGEAGFTVRDAADQLQRTPKSVRVKYCKLKGFSRKAAKHLPESTSMSSLDDPWARWIQTWPGTVTGRISTEIGIGPSIRQAALKVTEE
jgi:hypothetical protein